MAVLAALTAATGCDSAGTSTGNAVTHVRFTPGPGVRWQIQLSGAFDPEVAADVYDLDPYATEAGTVADLVTQGRRVICHLDVGVSDSSLPDAGRLPADVLGAPDGVGRRWLDIRRWSQIEPLLADRLDLCRIKGFQAVDADVAYGYARPTGFDLTGAEQLTYDREVATLAHSYGLAVGIRTLSAMAAEVLPFTDFTVVDGCFAIPMCSDYAPYVRAGKAVYDIESSTGIPLCTQARGYGFTVTGKPDPILDARAQPCA